MVILSLGENDQDCIMNTNFWQCVCSHFKVNHENENVTISWRLAETCCMQIAMCDFAIVTVVVHLFKNNWEKTAHFKNMITKN